MYGNASNAKPEGAAQVKITVTQQHIDAADLSRKAMDGYKSSTDCPVAISVRSIVKEGVLVRVYARDYELRMSGKDGVPLWYIAYLPPQAQFAIVSWDNHRQFTLREFDLDIPYEYRKE
jgi:hypothetical protein